MMQKIVIHILSIFVLVGCANMATRTQVCHRNCARAIARLDLDLDKARAAQLEMVAPREVRQTEYHLQLARVYYSRDRDSKNVDRNLWIAQQSLQRAQKLFACRWGELSRLLRAREQARFAINRCSSLNVHNAKHLLDDLDEQFRILSGRAPLFCREKIFEHTDLTELGRSYLELAERTRNLSCDHKYTSS